MVPDVLQLWQCPGFRFAPVRARVTGKPEETVLDKNWFRKKGNGNVTLAGDYTQIVQTV